MSKPKPEAAAKPAAKRKETRGAAKAQALRKDGPGIVVAPKPLGKKKKWGKGVDPSAGASGADFGQALVPKGLDVVEALAALVARSENMARSLLPRPQSLL